MRPMTLSLLAVLLTGAVLATVPAFGYSAGDACNQNKKIYTAEGPQGPALIYNGSTLQVFESADVSPTRKGVVTATPQTTLDVNGEIRVGNTNLTCAAAVEGALRWNTTDDTVEMCDGTNWKKIIAQAGAGAPANPPAGNGYFVITSGTWNGDLKTAGGQSTAHASINALCLTDLTNNDWLGKSDAQANGQLDSSHVKSFICYADTTNCNNAYPVTTYYFAVSGDNNHIPPNLVVDSRGSAVRGSLALDFPCTSSAWPRNLQENNVSNINELKIYH
jgi:hypothetical protein